MVQSVAWPGRNEPPIEPPFPASGWGAIFRVKKLVLGPFPHVYSDPENNFLAADRDFQVIIMMIVSFCPSSVFEADMRL